MGIARIEKQKGKPGNWPKAGMPRRTDRSVIRLALVLFPVTPRFHALNNHRRRSLCRWWDRSCYLHYCSV